MIKNDKMRKNAWMLATAVVAFMSSCLQAAPYDIVPKLENLKQTPVIEKLKEAETSGDWKKRAECYVEAFNMFDGGIRAIFGRKGMVPIEGRVTIMTSVYKRNEPFCMFNHYTAENCLDKRMDLEPRCCDLEQDTVGRYFKDNVREDLKKYIWSTLGVQVRKNKLPQAARIWEEYFIKPVAELLIAYCQKTEDSGPDEKKWPLLLDLYRGYHCSEDIRFFSDDRFLYSYGTFYEGSPESIPLHEYKNVHLEFYNGLAKVILHCTTSGEFTNKLCALLRDDEYNKVNDITYEGAGFYAIDIKSLVNNIRNIRNDQNQENVTLPKEISKAITDAETRADKRSARDDLRETARDIRKEFY